MLREEDMDPVQKPFEEQSQRPFWQQYLIIVGIVTIIALVGSLLLATELWSPQLGPETPLVVFFCGGLGGPRKVGVRARGLGCGKGSLSGWFRWQVSRSDDVWISVAAAAAAAAPRTTAPGTIAWYAASGVL